MDELTSRLRKLRPQELDDAQRALYDTIAGGPRSSGAFALTDGAGALEGPFNAMLLQPTLGDALQALGGAIRYQTTLTGRGREIATLLVAYGWESAFEQYAHEAIARVIGLSDAEMAALRDGRTDAFDDPGERLLAATTAALVGRGDLTDAEFEQARAGLGRPQLFELTTLVGYYATLALQLRVFRVAAPGPLDTVRGGRQDSE